MKLKDGFITHETGDEIILIATGDNSFSGLVKLNKTAGFIVDLLKEETTIDKMVKDLMENYEVDQNDAIDAINTVINKLKEIDAING